MGRHRTVGHQLTRPSPDKPDEHGTTPSALRFTNCGNASAGSHARKLTASCVLGRPLRETDTPGLDISTTSL